MFRRYIIFILLLVFLSLPNFLQAQGETDYGVIAEDVFEPTSLENPREEFYRGEVVEILEERQDDLGLELSQSYFQKLRVVFREGPREGEEAIIDYGSLSEGRKLPVGKKVIVVVPQNVEPFIFDSYRLSAVGGVAVLFVFLVVLVAGWRGFASLVGLVVSVLVVVLYMVPKIMAGESALVVSLVAALFISLVSVYLAHGFNRRTTVAVASILITVALAIGLAQLFVYWTSLNGLGSEEAFHLQTSPVAYINLRGLLLGGIIIGALGVLDDVTTAQAAAVEEIWRANPRLTRRELYKRSNSVGKEHITSMINTLALAYVGASLPALLLFTVYQRPWWVVANTEQISEEIIRTLVGSTALMLAVPITTLLAVYWLPRKVKVEVAESVDKV